MDNSWIAVIAFFYFWFLHKNCHIYLYISIFAQIRISFRIGQTHTTQGTGRVDPKSIQPSILPCTESLSPSSSTPFAISLRFHNRPSNSGHRSALSPVTSFLHFPFDLLSATASSPLPRVSVTPWPFQTTRTKI